MKVSRLCLMILILICATVAWETLLFAGDETKAPPKDMGGWERGGKYDKL